MKRRLKWALVLSLVVHSGLLLVWRRGPARRPAAPQPPATELVVVEIPTPEESKPGAPVAKPPAGKVPAPVAKAPPAKVRERAPVVKAPPVKSPPAKDEIAEPKVAQAQSAVLEGSPRGAILVPRDRAVQLPPPEEQESKGQTTRNRPEELPDPAAVLAYEAEVVHQRVDGWARKVLAKTRVENGVVSHYFHDLRHRLEKVTEEPPPFVEPFGLKSLPQHGKQAISSWSNGARRYGKTGTAYEDPAGYKELHGVAKSEAERGGEQARRFAQGTEAAARFRDFGDGRMGEELVAIVEVRQGSNGALADLSLISPSSSVRFDTWVMAQAPKAIDGLVAPPDAGVGIHAEGMRSVWAFKGRVTYKRDLKEAELLEDGWYVALMTIPGLLTGSFDEVTGKIEYIDLRHPRYECKVQLLEVY
ncbi:MAG: hypothetical protein H6Q89_180 [Myxococcaceae bacterium]|nr:hypothetical protein [Myxococcaceae bacterium]